MKRLLCTVLVLCCLMSSVCVASADQELGIEPRFVGISRLVAGLDINSSGRASCTGASSSVSGYSVTVIVELQKDGTTIKSWEESGTTVVISEDYYVTQNHDYQVITTAKVKTSGGLYLCSYTEASQIVHY